VDDDDAAGISVKLVINERKECMDVVGDDTNQQHEERMHQVMYMWTSTQRDIRNLTHQLYHLVLAMDLLWIRSYDLIDGP
jgi:hypothetical protein